MFDISNHLYRLWRCNSGQAISIELVLISTVLLIGLIAGGGSLRDSVVSEYNDSVLSVQNSNQSFSYNGLNYGTASTGGSNFIDALDVGDGQDISGQSLGISFSEAPINEADRDLAALLETLDFTFRMTRFGSVWTGTAGFAGGTYSASPYWPGTYTIAGDTITITMTPLGGGWSDGEIVLDASDPNNITGTLTWVNSFSGFVWEAVYELFGI